MAYKAAAAHNWNKEEDLNIFAEWLLCYVCLGLLLEMNIMLELHHPINVFATFSVGLIA